MTLAAGWIAGTVGLLVLHLAFEEAHLGGPAGSVRAVMLRRALAVVLLGVVPVAAVVATGVVLDTPVHLAALGLGLGDPMGLFVGLSLGVVAVPVVVLGGRAPSTRAHHPEIRLPRRSWGLVAADAAAWVAYLVAYELLFRGVLLLPLSEVLGPVAATAVVLAPYVAVHLSKGPGEAIGSVVSGTLFAALTLWSGSIWGAVVLHVLIAWAGEGGALFWNRELRVG